MSPYVVTGMDQPRLTGTYALCKSHRLIEGLMGVMRGMTQGVHHQRVTALNIWNLSF